jgi:hypothetical protein
VVERGNAKHSAGEDDMLVAELSGSLGQHGSNREEWIDRSHRRATTPLRGWGRRSRSGQACVDLDMWRAGPTLTVRVATAVTRDRARQCSGAYVRAHTAYACADLIGRRIAELNRRRASRAASNV